jgi:biotin carboxyl carrier protein
MKRYQITIGGQTYDVRLLTDPLQESVAVEVNGERLEVKVEALPPNAELSTVAPEIGSADPAATEAAADATTRAAAQLSRAVVAPLPGVIKSIAAQPGQAVVVGDELLVIEAMKMDNAIRATRDGTLGAVHVSEGHRVAHGQLLVEFRD